MQTAGQRSNQLVAVIKSRFSAKSLALIVDDVWGLEKFGELELALDCRSSMLVTSRRAMPGGWVSYTGVKLTGESNRPHQEAILASYVAGKSNETTVQLHLKVRSASTVKLCLYRDL